jgi:hypothetical protein
MGKRVNACRRSARKRGQPAQASEVGDQLIGKSVNQESGWFKLPQ